MTQRADTRARRATRGAGDERVSTDERQLFRDAVGPVQTLPKSQQRRRVPRSPPSPRPRQTEADEAAVMQELLDAPPVDIETGDSLSWRRNGVQLGVLRRLRRGHYRCQAELDLHGMFVDTARRRLAAFLRQALMHDYRCVRIVHGKGRRSGQRGPVLKAKVGGWLRRRDEVLAFCSTPDNDGGTGAVYVLLRRG